MGATWSFTKIFVSGEILTAAQLNQLQTDITNNFTPSGMDDYSSTLAEMKTKTSPAGGSQPTDLSGELERIR